MLAVAFAMGLVPLAAHADEGDSPIVPIASIEAPHVSDEVIVVYESEPVAEGARTFSLEEEPDIESLGYEVTEELGESPDSAPAVVASVPDGKSVEDAIAELEAAPGVAYAQPNYEYSLIDSVESTDGGVAQALGAEALATGGVNDPLCNDSMTYNANQYSLFQSKSVQAWDSAKSEGAVTVAVLDTGCRLDHVDLQGVLDVENAYDTFNDAFLSDLAASGKVANGDAVGHGTHVSGIIGATTNNGIGMAGASYNAKVLPIKVFKDPTSPNEAATALVSDIIEAYERLINLMDTGAIDNLRVINLSLGLPAASLGKEGDRAFEQAIEAMRSKGVLTVCAGGNGENGIPLTARSLPSDYDACLSVTSLDRDGGNTYYSDYNQWKDISAPGTNITSASHKAAGGYTTKNGTSMASPLVGGIAALLWAANPNLTVDEAVKALLDTADPVVDPDNDRRGTSGSKGAVDAEAAVKSVKSTPAPPGPATVSRLAGGNALGTMTAITTQGFAAGSCPSVVVATLDGYWDALTASALAGLKSCPVLITDGSSLSTETASEIKRLGARTVYIAGGPAAVSEDVRASIARLSGVTSIVRLAGADAIGTALNIYEAGKGSWGTTAVVATSATFQDALSASPYAYARRAPVFLANATTRELDPRVVAAIRAGGFTRVLITGGKEAISAHVESQLSGITCVRKGGATAYETSSDIAAWCLSQGMSAGNPGIATGESYYDALTGAALCGKNNAALVLVSDENRSVISSFIRQNKDSVRNAYVFGGPAAVSDATYRAVAAALA